MPTDMHITTPVDDNAPSFTWNPVTDDFAGVAGYSVKIDDDEWVWVGNMTSWTSPDVVSDDDHTFFVKAKDNVDNKNEESISLGFSIEATPPTITPGQTLLQKFLSPILASMGAVSLVLALWLRKRG